MTKEELITEARRLAAAGELTRSELVAIFEKESSDSVPHRRFAVIRTLYFVGGLIVCLGVVFLIQQNWDVLPSPIRILVTLGTAIALYIAGTLMSVGGHRSGAAPIFFVLSALLAPVGLAVALNELGVDWSGAGVQALHAGFLAIVFLLSRISLRQSLFTFFALVASTWCYYALITWFLPDVATTTLRLDLIYAYATLLLGIALVLLGFGFQSTQERDYTEPLYLFGLSAFFGASFTLAGYGFLTFGSILWEALLPGLAVGAVLLSIPLHSRAFLFMGALALTGDLIKLTSQYFPGVLGWPITLILTGFVVMGMGYGTYRMHRRFIQ